MSNPLNITAARIRRPPPRARAAGEPGEALHIAVEVDNPGDQTLHVWVTRRAYEYDPASGALTVYLTEHTPPPPPGIEMISNHPRTPLQVPVEAHARATLDVLVPSTIRRRLPNPGLGIAFVEEPIGPVAHIALHIQAATEPIGPIRDEKPDQYRERLCRHGEVARATITPTEQKE